MLSRRVVRSSLTFLPAQHSLLTAGPFFFLLLPVQTEAKAGQTHYKGLFNAFRVITQEEGVKALFKGGIPRIIRSSPQSV